jgi:hyaluronan synthase
MPEGYEMKVDIGAKYIRTCTAKVEEGKMLCGMVFNRTLAQYATASKHWQLLSMASLFLFIAVLCVFLLQAESVIFFKYNKVIYSYSLIVAIFLLSRYLFGSFYRPVPIDPDFTPSVSIIIPCFNEEKWIQRTILSCINQDYPQDKLEVIVVDDCSSDNSFEVIKEFVEELKKTERHHYDIDNMITYVRHDENAGKKESLATGVLKAKNELVVFVDSDSFLDPFAVRNIVQPFRDSEMGGVTGRTDIANTYTNALTKMQAVYYYIEFRVIKASESIFDMVTCLSGPLSCYRKELVLENLTTWREQVFLGYKSTLGDDRAMTNLILKNHRTCYQDTAICTTIVPNTQSVFLKQQLRWNRSWFVESMLALRFIWKKEPFATLLFCIGVFLTLTAPLIVIYNMFYVPIVYEIFPFIFLVGLLTMATLLSMSQLLLRRSTTWIYGILFCLYYIGVLLWLVPYACATYWKDTWGTRPTKADLLDAERIKNKNLGTGLWR